MSAEQVVEKGQVWERISDGTRIEVVVYNEKWDDVRYRVLKQGGRYRDIYASYLRDRYRLIGNDAGEVNELAVAFVCLLGLLLAPVLIAVFG